MALGNIKLYVARPTGADAVQAVDGGTRKKK